MGRVALVRVVCAVLAWAMALAVPRMGHSQAALSADEGPPAPVREFRGVWVATVANIDWPSRPGLPVARLREEMERILDAAAGCNLNAVLLQVRPSCDAMYLSKREPWSEFLTGESGRPPGGAGAEAGYDPLREWIEAAHARGLELHAWVNPFRARHMKATRPDAESHVSRTRPDLVRAYDGYLWLDPGEPEARAHTLAVIEDLVRRYDVDGLHLDDYFYPYPKKGEAFPDDASFAKQAAAGAGEALQTREDWRRANINGFVRETYQLVKSIKPHVRVGVSPFGIWRPGHPAGVKGFDAYDGLYADARLWLVEGWMDYIAPQLYWKIDAPEQPFRELLKWWTVQRPRVPYVPRSVPVWPGLYATRINDTKESWQPREILDQIAVAREVVPDGVASGPVGVVLYSAIGLVENRKGLADALRAGPFAEAAMVPPMPSSSAKLEPGPVVVTARAVGAEVSVVVSAVPTRRPVAEPRRLVVWTRTEGGVWGWRAMSMRAGALGEYRLPAGSGPDRVVEVAAASVDWFGRLGPIARVSVVSAGQR